MTGQQKVIRLRRNYNILVANETLEDYALRFTAKRFRRWSASRVALTALGAISFLALEAIGGAITLSYGFSNAVLAIAAVSLIIFLTGIPISYHAAKEGVDIDLLTRGAGFGYIGSTITSLIYASFTFIFFALEAAIMSLALELTLGVPLTIGYVISSLIVIPIVTHGITWISRFQIYTQPVWLLLQLLPILGIALQFDDAMQLWTEYRPPGSDSPDRSSEPGGLLSGFDLMAFGAASAVLFSLIAQIGEQVDFQRFMPLRKNTGRAWLLSVIAAGPGWIVPGALKILIGSFLAVLAVHHGLSLTEAADPNYMYLTAFSYITSSPELMLILVGTFVILSQLKINVTNAYAGSIAWSNFFSRLTHNHPGRVIWLVFNVAIALMLMELGIYRVLEEILTAYAIVALAWVGTLVADLTINRSLGLRPKQMEFKRAHLFDINPVGVGSMLIATMAGFACYFGFFGEVLQALASYIALAITFVMAPLLAWWTKGQFYLARPVVFFPQKHELKCCICEHDFETEDMSHCPAYAGPICSLCCSLDTRCHDQCKTNSRIADQITIVLMKLFPATWVRKLDSRTGHFLGIFFLTTMVIAALLALVYYQIVFDLGVDQGILSSALINVFLILTIVCGVVSWMFTLVHESRQMALEESKRQTHLLEEEIAAHKQTDKELQRAKEVAEAANLAKSRYLTGISHELRSPLNAILGYAQLLDKDVNIPNKLKDALRIIRRSSEHLADLIEGLLDISRIEAGRLELTTEQVALPILLDQIINMFRIQAENKGITIEYRVRDALPELVKADEKRLRQILINLISNAVKYTHEGKVSVTVGYRNNVAEFRIQDTGIGIASSDMETIFKPFERIRKAGEPHVAGTGLGLTITRLLTDIMGGDLTVTSKQGVGSEFKLSLMLSPLTISTRNSNEQRICGYEGREITVFLVDDEPSHRRFLDDVLNPLGFKLIQAPDGETCLEMLAMVDPDIFLLDVSMPGMDGWQLANLLRVRLPDACIIMTSANAHETLPPIAGDAPHNAYLTKPIQIQTLLDALARHAGIKWKNVNLTDQGTFDKLEVNVGDASARKFSDEIKMNLKQLATIGSANAICALLDSLRETDQFDSGLINRMYEQAKRFEFTSLLHLIEEH